MVRKRIDTRREKRSVLFKMNLGIAHPSHVPDTAPIICVQFLAPTTYAAEPDIGFT
jgi:hypothetical protein